MHKNWVRILTIILLFYTVIAGMIWPLNSGIKDIQKTQAKSGSTFTTRINTYNTHLTKLDNVAWLIIDSLYAIKASETKVLTDDAIEVSFDLPVCLPYEEQYVNGSIIIANEQDGTFARPNALTITQDSVNTSAGQIAWKAHKVEQLPAGKVKGFPFRLILEETIRNIYFHVTFWLAMVIIFTVSVFHSIKYLIKKDPLSHLYVRSLNQVGLYFGIIGLITGAIWARFTWGQFWSGDIKQNMTAIALLIYAAYFILSRSFKDDIVQARISNVYNIFAYFAMIPLIYIIPRMYDSLHPGNGGNPAIGGEDLDNTMRLVFYPGVIAFTLVGLWIANLFYRLLKIDFTLRQ